MDIASILSSFNIISIFAFFITLLFLMYESYLFIKGRQKKSKIIIPDFKADVPVSSLSASSIIWEEKKNTNKVSPIPLIAGLILLVVFAIISVIGILGSKRKSSEISTVPTPIVSFTSSKGLKFYTLDWKELPENDIMNIATKSAIIIGIETVSGADIDRARIRINDHAWTSESITKQFDKKTNVFYKQFEIASYKEGLRIEAQLHSKNEGWLE